MVVELSSPSPDAAEGKGGSAELAAALSSKMGAAADGGDSGTQQGGEGLDMNAVARFASVLRTAPVFNYQTVYGVIMVPAKQVIIPIN